MSWQNIKVQLHEMAHSDEHEQVKVNAREDHKEGQRINKWLGWDGWVAIPKKAVKERK